MRARLAEVAPTLNIDERFWLLHRLGVYHGRNSASGLASDTAATLPLRAALPGLRRDLQVASVVDAPCGDCHWMALAGFCGLDSYLGLDIVGDVVAQNQAHHGAPGRRFRRADITIDPIERADLILCRDAFIHLGDADVLAALCNFVASDSKWLLTTSFDRRRGNADILAGWFRPISLEAPPFSLPRPLRRLSEIDPSGERLYPDRALALWPLAAVADRLRASPPT
jgi:hypothetical protein